MKRELDSFRRHLLALDYARLLKEHALGPPSAGVPLTETDVLVSDSPSVSALWSAAKKLEWKGSSNAVSAGEFDHLLAFISRAITPEVWKKVDEETFFGIYPTGDFNALAVRSEHGVLCLLHDGLVDLIRVFAAVFGRLTHDLKDNACFDAYRRSETYQKLVTYLVSGIRNTFRCDHAGLKAFGRPDGIVDEASLSIQTHLSNAMQMFVLAHELGHIAGGHLKNGDIRHVNTPSGKLEILSPDQEEEFWADQFGNDVLWNLDQGVTTLPFAWGSPCFLTAILLQEIVGCKIAGHSFCANKSNCSHPPTLARYSRLCGQTMMREVEESLNGIHFKRKLSEFTWRLKQFTTDVLFSTISLTATSVTVRADLNQSLESRESVSRVWLALMEGEAVYSPDEVKMAGTDDITQMSRCVFSQAMKTPNPSAYLLDFYRRLRATASPDTVIAMLLALDGQVEEQGSPPVMVAAMREAAGEVGGVDPPMAFYFYRALGRELFYCRSRESLEWYDRAVMIGEALDDPGELADDLRDLKKAITLTRRKLLWLFR